MLEVILKLYTMAMAGDVRSPVPHLFGPPGCGKSTTVEQAAEVIGCTLHVINVSRISPLELEGLQMPVENNTRVHMIPAVFWSRLQEGDILLLDEFLRGFPEVYNGLLDILTSRRVGSFVLPKVFIIAASNTTVAYDKALEDRLQHLPVPDPRKKKTEKARLAKMIVDQLGLLPRMATSLEMEQLFDDEILPMFDVLDNLKNRSASPEGLKGHSIRNLIGQAQLRSVQSSALQELISMNNTAALREDKAQYVLLTGRKDITAVGTAYSSKAEKLRGNPKLTPIQVQNLNLNLQLIELESIRYEKGELPDDESDDNPFFS